MTLQDHSPAPAPVRAPGRYYHVLGRMRTADGWTTMVEIITRTTRTVTVELYHVQAVPADYGRAFRWQGMGAKASSCYHLNLCDEGGGEIHGQCECMAGCAQKVVCRHVALTLALIQNGEI